MKGFRKLAPPQARVPLPYPMLAQIMIYIGTILKAPMVSLWLGLTWSLCCRPGESLKLIWGQIVAPNAVNKQWSVLLSMSSPIEGKSEPSKTGELDEAIVLDHPYLKWMLKSLNTLKKVHGPDDQVFQFDLKKGSAMFSQAVDELGFQKVGIQCVYQIRHGSASTDMIKRQRSTEELMKRGRWKCLSSLRRYEQGGRLSQVFGKLTESQQSLALHAEKQVGATMVRLLG